MSTSRILVPAIRTARRALVSALVGTLVCAPASGATNPEIKPATAKEILKLVAEPGARATVVNIWATWCAPCKEEMPEIVKFRQDHLAKGVRVILVAANRADSAEEIKEAATFLSAARVDFSSYALVESPERFVREFDADWGTPTVPATFFFHSSGKKHSAKIGRVTLSELRSRIAPLLKGAPPAK